MTDQTPVERAAQAIRDDWQAGMKATEMDLRDARTAFDSIDVEHLTAVILRTQFPGGIKVGHADKIAHTIKNWLTGKDTQ